MSLVRAECIGECVTTGDQGTIFIVDGNGRRRLCPLKCCLGWSVSVVIGKDIAIAALIFYSCVDGRIGI